MYVCVCACFSFSSVPIFTLPDEVNTLAADDEMVKELDLPTLLPLVLDTESLTGIFLGAITDWLDPRMLSLNPQLEPWFRAANCSTNLTIVVGATSANDPNTASRLLFSLMTQSTFADKSEYAWAFPLKDASLTAGTGTKSYNQYFTTVPFRAVAARAPSSTILIDVEDRLPIKSTTTSGSVSYRLVGTGSGTGEFSPASEFQLKVINSDGVTQIVQPDSNALRSCSQVYTILDGRSLVSTDDTVSSDELLSGVDAESLAESIRSVRNWDTQTQWIDSNRPAPNCWPISSRAHTHIRDKTRGEERKGGGRDCNESKQSKADERMHCRSRRHLNIPTDTHLFLFSSLSLSLSFSLSLLWFFLLFFLSSSSPSSHHLKQCVRQTTHAVITLHLLLLLRVHCCDDLLIALFCCDSRVDYLSFFLCLLVFVCLLVCLFSLQQYLGLSRCPTPPHRQVRVAQR